MLQEFAHDEEEIKRAQMYGAKADKLGTALHEVIGHASGKLEEGVADSKENFEKLCFDPGRSKSRHYSALFYHGSKNHWSLD